MIRILIADDHAIVRKGLRQIITDEFPSATIIEVNDVESLVMQVIKEDWDVIICDISMPGRSGVEALEQIKQIKPEIPVLMMSMHSEDQYALRVLKAGAAGFLNKSSVHEELIKAIQTVRNGRKYITPSIAERLAGTLNAPIGKQPHQSSGRERRQPCRRRGASHEEVADGGGRGREPSRDPGDQRHRDEQPQAPAENGIEEALEVERPGVHRWEENEDGAGSRQCDEDDPEGEERAFGQGGRRGPLHRARPSSRLLPVSLPRHGLGLIFAISSSICAA